VQDRLGLALGTTSVRAAEAFDHAIDGCVGYRADMAERMAAVFDADAEFGLAHSLKGWLLMMAFPSDFVPLAREALTLARRSSSTPRESAHAEALAHWIDNDLPGAIAVWDRILQENPRDILAFRLAHFLNFWQGRHQDALTFMRPVVGEMWRLGGSHAQQDVLEQLFLDSALRADF
jgi:hypothetical protein